MQPGEFTIFLQQCSNGDKSELDALTPVVYAELRRPAAGGLAAADTIGLASRGSMAELSADQWTLVGELFERAAELPLELRPAFLTSECLDEEFRQEVVSLLQHLRGGLLTAGQSIASLAAAVAQEKDPDQWLVGARLGPYRVEAIVGNEDMGAMYRADRMIPSSAGGWPSSRYG